MDVSNSISYAFLACNEKEELFNSLKLINHVKRPQDEVVVLLDELSYDPQILKGLNDLVDVIKFHPLNMDFATQKNVLIDHCTKNYILNLDADEYISIKQLRLIPEILKLNPKVDLFYLPRINTVDGITKQHISQWGWNISNNEYIKGTISLNDKHDYDVVKFIKLLESYNYIISKNDEYIDYYKPIINYPDLQGRLWKNNNIIHWKGKVHERLRAFTSIATLPVHIIHNKGIIKQEQQNEFYTKIN